MATPATPAADAAALSRIVRAIYPHPKVPDGPYLRSAEAIIASVADSTQDYTVIAEGVRSLEGVLGTPVVAAEAEPLTAALTAAQQTAFFRLVQSSSVVTLYSDPETWEVLGYEGPSFDKGGYLTRGFNDLSWLPEPRITEYDGEPMADVVPGGAPGTTTAGGAS
ncbi:hypothetical protein JT358_06555 [Micrococcales bacterium 31B]|nr:hypothetical protein [Micrococcales bacterium 31B]